MLRGVSTGSGADGQRGEFMTSGGRAHSAHTYPVSLNNKETDWSILLFSYFIFAGPSAEAVIQSSLTVYGSFTHIQAFQLLSLFFPLSLFFFFFTFPHESKTRKNMKNGLGGENRRECRHRAPER